MSQRILKQTFILPYQFLSAPPFGLHFFRKRQQLTDDHHHTVPLTSYRSLLVCHSPPSFPTTNTANIRATYELLQHIVKIAARARIYSSHSLIHL